MIECAHCGTQNRKGSKFCSNCGQRLDIVPDGVCGTCSRLSPPGSAFCQFCGAALPAADPPRLQGPAGAGAKSQQLCGASGPAPLGETAAAVPEATIPSELSELRQSAGQDSGKGLARRVPSWLYGAKSGAAVAPIPNVEPDHAQSKNKYLEGIGDVLVPAEAWLLPGKE
jgi:hypothetical protein